MQVPLLSPTSSDKESPGVLFVVHPLQRVLPDRSKAENERRSTTSDPPPPPTIFPSSPFIQVSLRFADAATLDSVLGVAQGAVSPLAVVNDTEGVATLAVDKGLIDADEVLVHPLRNDRSIRLKAADLVKVGGVRFVCFFFV